MLKPNTLRLENYTDDFFEVNSINGFLPKKSPLLKLPERYQELQKLIDEMPIKKKMEAMDCFQKKEPLSRVLKAYLT